MDMIKEVNIINTINCINVDILNNREETEAVVNNLNKSLTNDLDIDSKMAYFDTINSKLIDIINENKESSSFNDIYRNIEYVYTNTNFENKNIYLLNLKFRIIIYKYHNSKNVLKEKLLDLLNSELNSGLQYNEKTFNIYKSIALYCIRTGIDEVAKLAIDKINETNWEANEINE